MRVACFCMLLRVCGCVCVCVAWRVLRVRVIACGVACVSCLLVCEMGCAIGLDFLNFLARNLKKQLNAHFSLSHRSKDNPSKWLFSHG